MEFDWDPATHEWTRRERGFFAGQTVEIIDRRLNYGEVRIRSIGELDGRVYVVVYTDRPGVRWIISA